MFVGGSNCQRIVTGKQPLVGHFYFAGVVFECCDRLRVTGPGIRFGYFGFAFRTGFQCFKAGRPFFNKFRFRKVVHHVFHSRALDRGLRLEFHLFSAEVINHSSRNQQQKNNRGEESEKRFHETWSLERQDLT